MINENIKVEETELNEDGVYVVKEKRSRLRTVLLGVSVAAGVAIGAGLLSVLRTEEEEAEDLIDEDGELNEDAVIELVISESDEEPEEVA